jgi:hypothetical protein
MTVRDDGRVGTAVIGPDGTVERVLDIADPTLNLVCTVWSPDGQRILTAGHGHLLVLTVSGEVSTDIHQDGSDGVFLFGPVWSPDGTDVRRVSDTAPIKDTRVEWVRSSGWSGCVVGGRG